MSPKRSPIARVYCVPSEKEKLLCLQMSKLIMQHMSKEPFKLSSWPLLCLSVTLLNSKLKIVPSYPLAWAINVAVLGGYLHYVISTILEICAYLHIKCFSIPPLAKEESK